MEKKSKSQNTFPIFHSSARTLQEMASSRFAYVCWCSKIINKPYSGSTWGQKKWYEKNTFSCTEILPVPVRIRSKIDHKISLIGQELQMWSKHNNFGSVIPREVVVDCVVFDSDDNICYKKTAKNLLKANPAALCPIEQFEIACKYNFEEDIKHLWPLVKDFLPSNVFRFNYSTPFTRFRTMDYWCSRMRGELQQVYGYRASCPEFYVLQRQRCDRLMEDWGEIEYFWKKLDIKEQTYLMNDYLWMNNFIHHLIWNIDNAMLENIAKSVPNLLLEHFASDELYYEYTLQIWNHVKSSFIEDKQSFYRILIDLSAMAFHRPNDKGYSHLATLLKEIWLSAPDELKMYICYYCRFGEVLDIVEGEFLARSIMQFVDIRSFGCDIGFFIELSRNCSFETRQRIWRMWWWKFVILAEVPDLLEMMIVCFGNAKDIVAFKKTTMLDPEALQDICEQFVGQGLDDKLDEYLKFCCSDDDDEIRVLAVREKIILGNKDGRVGNS